MENNLFDIIEKMPVEYGAFKSKIIKTDEIKTDACFRDMCKSNACGAYGKCWMCPPAVGDIHALMSEVKKYDYALVYQTVTGLEDSYDYEGMVAAKKESYKLAQKIRERFNALFDTNALHLGSGGCGVCESCAKKIDEPCRFPSRAMPSLEAYGVNVSELAKSADMKYINGADTVTYFGAVLFSFGGDKK